MSGTVLVVNAGCKVEDTRHLITHIGHRCSIVPMAPSQIRTRSARAAKKRLVIKRCSDLLNNSTTNSISKYKPAKMPKPITHEPKR